MVATENVVFKSDLSVCIPFLLSLNSHLNFLSTEPQGQFLAELSLFQLWVTGFKLILRTSYKIDVIHYKLPWKVKENRETHNPRPKIGSHPIFVKAQTLSLYLSLLWLLILILVLALVLSLTLSSNINY